jgi:exosortase D (VPLPA-CTERM-specific)
MLKNSTMQKNKPVYFFLILVCLVSGFWPVLHKMAIRWSSGDNSYCYLVVPLFLYLCYDKRKNFQFGKFSWSLAGIIPLILSLSLIIAGELASVETLLFLGIWGCLTSLAITLYGRRSRLLFFPFLILLFIIPLPPFLNRLLTFKMKMMASSLSVEMLRLAGISVLQDGNIIDLGLKRLQVVDACSGLRYIASMFLMSLLIGHFFLNSLWKKLILLIMVYPLTIAVNGMRIFISGIATIKGYGFIVEGKYHDAAGIIAFLIAGAILVICATIMQKSGSRAHPSPAGDKAPKIKASIRPLVLTVIYCALFLGIGWSLKNLSAAMIIPQRTEFTSFPMTIADWHGNRSYLDQKILDALWADDYVSATFYKKSTGNTIHLLIPYYEYQGTRHTAHAPQSCLLGGGWALINTKEEAFNLPSGRKIKIRIMEMHKGNARMLAGYFFLQRGRIITSPWLNKLYLIQDALQRRRTDGALVRVEISIPPEQDVRTARKLLTEFVTNLQPLLPEYIPE